jgi:mannan endo-1,4-beta-mannosidase
MTIRHLTLIVLCIFALIEVTQITPAYSNQNKEHTTKGITDPEATEETRALFYNLRQLAKSKLLFGHQATTAYGVGWFAEEYRS